MKRVILSAAFIVCFSACFFARGAQAAENKILVAYFSTKGATASVASKIASAASADIYEIKPAVPYTDADLNYNDDNSRSTKEMKNEHARPAISNKVSDMAGYGVVFIGYPIWWGEAPRIINTFLESYDFTGKTIVPFCTSGGSGMGRSASLLAKRAPRAKWLSGARLSPSEPQEEVLKWVNGLGI